MKTSTKEQENNQDPCPCNKEGLALRLPNFVCKCNRCCLKCISWLDFSLADCRFH